MCAISEDTGINHKKKTIVSSNTECITDYSCEGTNMAAKCKIFLTHMCIQFQNLLILIKKIKYDFQTRTTMW